MIPKKIHYCWFGGNPLPELAIKCIESWKKYFPDYEIVEWNEKNYNVEEKCDYIREAYGAKKWAFVSDYARYDILYQYGGVYFDTDVEVIKSMEEVIKNGSFMGFEYSKNKKIKVAPGLGMGSLPKQKFYKEILDYYNKIHFLNKDGSYNQITIVEYTTDLLKKYGLIENNIIQKVEDVVIYPTEYFCPLNYETGKILITDKTVSIHHYTSSWLTEKEKKVKEFERKLLNGYGQKKIDILTKSILYRLIKNLYMNGLKQTIKKMKKKLIKVKIK